MLVFIFAVWQDVENADLRDFALSGGRGGGGPLGRTQVRSASANTQSTVTVATEVSHYRLKFPFAPVDTLCVV